MSRIAKKIINPDMLAPDLGISPAERESIKRDSSGFENQKHNLLLAWKRKNGTQATLSLLIPILCNMEDVDVAEDICKLFTRKY